jgi:hypothetical protein
MRVEGTEPYCEEEGPYNATRRDYSKFGGPFNFDDFDEEGGRGGWEFTYYFKRPILVKGYVIQTANDCPNRDPVCWRVTNKKGELIDEQVDAEPRGRFQKKVYRVKGLGVWARSLTFSITR